MSGSRWFKNASICGWNNLNMALNQGGPAKKGKHDRRRTSRASRLARTLGARSHSLPSGCRHTDRWDSPRNPWRSHSGGRWPGRCWATVRWQEGCSHRRVNQYGSRKQGCQRLARSGNSAGRMGLWSCWQFDIHGLSLVFATANTRLCCRVCWHITCLKNWLDISLPRLRNNKG